MIPRTNLCKVITEEVTETFEGQIKIFESMIPNTVKVGESVYYSEPLVEYAPDSKACVAYNNLAKELIENEGVNSTKRKIFDAVDLLAGVASSQMPVKTMKGGVTMLDIGSVKPISTHHPFHLYEGDRLDDMVESIRDHGILNPVIVRKIDDGYEMLSGPQEQTECCKDSRT